MNYGRSCPKMTYIGSGLRERASTSRARVPSLCRVAEKVGGKGEKKGFVGHPVSFACQNSRAHRRRSLALSSREKERIGEPREHSREP